MNLNSIQSTKAIDGEYIEDSTRQISSFFSSVMTLTWEPKDMSIRTVRCDVH